MYAYEISYSPCIPQKLSVWKAIKETILEPRLACSNLDYENMPLLVLSVPVTIVPVLHRCWKEQNWLWSRVIGSLGFDLSNPLNLTLWFIGWTMNIPAYIGSKIRQLRFEVLNTLTKI